MGALSLRLWAILLAGVVLGVPLAHSAPTQVLLEIRSRGGYRDTGAPEEFIQIRVFPDGRLVCHCDDYRWAEGRIDEERIGELGKAIKDSGFLDLGSGTSKVKGWWRGKFVDAPTVEYLANVDGKRKFYRRNDLREPEPEALQKLRQLAEPLREELCRITEQADEPKP